MSVSDCLVLYLNFLEFLKSPVLAVVGSLGAVDNAFAVPATSKSSARIFVRLLKRPRPLGVVVVSIVRLVELLRLICVFGSLVSIDIVFVISLNGTSVKSLCIFSTVGEVLSKGAGVGDEDTNLLLCRHLPFA